MSRFHFGNMSLQRLRTCHPNLQAVAHVAMGLDLMDFTVLVGHRPEMAQYAAWRSGASKLQWPNSRHNHLPSLAMDLAPYPIRWGDKHLPDGSVNPHRVKDIGRFYKLAGITLAVARDLGIALRWGGDWNMNGDVYDQDFDDLVHFELVLS